MIAQFMATQTISLNRGKPEDYPIILIGDLFELLIFHLLIQKGYTVHKPSKDIGIDFIASKNEIVYAIQVKFRSNAEHVFNEEEFTTFKTAFKKYKRTLAVDEKNRIKMLIITNATRMEMDNIAWIDNKRLEQELTPYWHTFAGFINSFKK